MAKDLFVVLQVYLVLSGLQLVIWPWLYRYLQQLVDRGWVMGRVLITLGLASIIWWLSHFKVPINTALGVTIVLIMFVGLTWTRLKKEIKNAFVFIKVNWQVILTEEILLFGGLVIFSLVRGFQPDILGLEKFMDFGFIKSYLNSPTLPAADMWMAGKAINYYSFGHFWASILIRIWGVIPSVGYNLMLAFLFATSFCLAFSTVINLGSKFSFRWLLGGLVGGFLVTVAGNSHTISTLLTKGSLSGYWYADATRFIHNSIHEFPSYSFVVSDLHAHILGLPVVLLFILFMTIWIKNERKLVLDAILGWLLGIMAMTNTWDIATYSLLLSIACLIRVLFEPKKILSIILSSLTVFLAAGLTALEWKFGFDSISKGVGLVIERSPLKQLLYLWIGHLIIVLIATVVNFKILKNKNLMVYVLAITAILLIIIPEFVYAKDIYAGHPRANTMFKLTFQAFVMMSLLGGWTVGQIFSIKNKVFRVLGVSILAFLVSGLSLFPTQAYSSYYGQFKRYRGLDGTAYLMTTDPNEVEIIDYLEKNRNGKNIVEAVGDSFTEFNAISSYTGIPTAIGWRSHEWLWRTTYDEVGKRDGEVTRFYENNNPGETLELINKYNIGWIVVTRREREKYRVDEYGLKRLGEVVWQRGNEYLIKID